MKNYIKNKGILVGKFDEDDLRNKRDKIQVDKIMKETGLKYVNTEYVKRKDKTTHIKIYLCTIEDFKI